MSDTSPQSKRLKTGHKVIGTHNGTFHCDEALAVFLLRQTAGYATADLKRTRDPAILDSCDIVVDVGAIYDEAKQRFDHHQRGFTEVFGHGFNTKLSSAGLVYKHFGKEIIANRLQLSIDDPKVELLWLKLYREFIEAIDAIDNGISQYPTDIKPLYRGRTDLSSRVAHLNPAWNESTNAEAVDARFLEASKLTGTEFLGRLDYYANAWLPARDLLIEAINKSKETVDPTGRIIVFTQFLPWKEHLFELESTGVVAADVATYVVYPDETAGNWRVQAVPVSPESFESRKALPEEWRGLRDDELSRASDIEGGIFIHASGFIGGNKTQDGALKLAKVSLDNLLRSKTGLVSSPRTVSAPASKANKHTSSPPTSPLASSSATSSSRSTGESFKSLKHRRVTSSTDTEFQQLQSSGQSQKGIDTKKYRNFQSYPRKMSFLKANYHPLLFTLITMSSMAELILTAFLIGKGNEHGTWPTKRYHSLLIMFCFNSSWTTVFSSAYMLWMVDGGSQFLASVASSVIWLMVTTILWGVAAGVMHDTRGGGDCALEPVIHRCRQSLTVEALGWTEFGLCTLTLILTCLWIKSNNFRRKQEIKLFLANEWLPPLKCTFMGPGKIIRWGKADQIPEFAMPGPATRSIETEEHDDLHATNESEPLLRRSQTSLTAQDPEKYAFLVRAIALLCVCSLSVGVHYAGYILGPLKSRIQRELGTSHAEFGVLFSAYSLNSTWTPLVAGLLVSRLGTTVASILATGIVFFGQFILLVGELCGNIRLMAFGLFIFGMGSTPLAVVQETMVVRFFRSHGLGVSMALGLVAGKGSSFLAARTSYPLTVHFGSSAPFYVATFLSGFSFAINFVYLACSRWLIDGSGAELEAPDLLHDAQQTAQTDSAKSLALKETAEKRKVKITEIAELGDLFWAYIFLNVLCGMIWHPFAQLAANIIEKRYQLTEQEAAVDASYLLAGPILLYPICGFVVDYYKNQPIATYLLILSSTLTAAAYAWLAMPPTWTSTPIPAIVSFALGYGFSPLMLVVIVPKIVSPKYVSTALGAHKSLEQTGTTLFQTLAGLLLDVTSKEETNAVAAQRILNTFLSLNGAHMFAIGLLASLQWRRNYTRKERPQEPIQSHELLDSGDSITNSLVQYQTLSNQSTSTGHTYVPSESFIVSVAERRRGKLFTIVSTLLSSGSATSRTRYGKMGAYKYIGELYKKKQSDVLRFLFRVRCWEYRQLNVIHRASRPSRPDKARRLGYKAKQGYVIYRIRVRRGNRKKPVPKGATYGKPVRQGVNHLKPQRSLRSVAEERVGRRCGNLRVLNSYWVNQDGVYKYYEVILVDPSHKAVRRDPRINWIVNPVHKRREARGLTSAGKQANLFVMLHSLPSCLAFLLLSHLRIAIAKRDLQPRNSLNTDPNGTTFIWLPQDEYSGPSFFDRWDFFTGPDPTHGTVNYTTQEDAFATGLAYVLPNGKVVMQGDNTTWLSQGESRRSVRISSKAQYNGGLFILDLDMAPWGCGVWPAFWTVGASNWPYTGEIDIIEGVHDNEHNQVTFHTAPGCVLNPNASFTGTVVQSNGQNNTQCNALINDNAGCAVLEVSRASYGPYFDSLGGGVFAMKWDENSIAVWSFYRQAVPSDITQGSPDPSKWGVPVAQLDPASCTLSEYFANHSIIFDITFCGDWAGNSYASTNCPGTCADRLMDPANFVNASWIINNLKVYRKQILAGRVESDAIRVMPWSAFGVVLATLAAIVTWML
ncbi:hypothetical protein NP233_g285 [Leucocoprinus birnbaumii]|uniref:Ribosomal protein L15 n=1 Tax=Leucocoprinus birnbaumii TaxID=56174 RepID=A0AAD5W4A7_9AGAR|nr:hypothetical protein NP233_g285 [Leucocoprinus birnbaumii]